MPIFLIQALFGLGGVCFILCITTFHYFKDKVDEHTIRKTREIFSSPSFNRFIRMIRSGNLPLVVIRDFNKDLFKTSSPLRRLHSLLLFFPVSGCLLILSASFASLGSIENEFVSQIATMLEYLADSALLVAIIMIVWCAVCLVKLTRELV